MTRYRFEILTSLGELRRRPRIGTTCGCAAKRQPPPPGPKPWPNGSRLCAAGQALHPIVFDGSRPVAAIMLAGRKIRGPLELGSLPINDWSDCGDLLLDPAARRGSGGVALASSGRICPLAARLVPVDHIGCRRAGNCWPPRLGTRGWASIGNTNAMSAASAGRPIGKSTKPAGRPIIAGTCACRSAAHWPMAGSSCGCMPMPAASICGSCSSRDSRSSIAVGKARPALPFVSKTN